MHFVARRAAVGAAIVAIAGIGTTTVAATKMPFGGHTSTLNTLSLSGTVSIDNAPGRTGTVRERIIVPRTWKRTSSSDEGAGSAREHGSTLTSSCTTTSRSARARRSTRERSSEPTVSDTSRRRRA
jgi:hypothetical protein